MFSGSRKNKCRSGFGFGAKSRLVADWSRSGDKSWSKSESQAVYWSLAEDRSWSESGNVAKSWAELTPK